MYVRLVDKDNFKSPILYIHADEEEFMKQIELWLEQVKKVIADYPQVDGLPLGRLEPDTAMVDLVRHLGNYYVESTPLSFLPVGHVYGCLRLVNETDSLRYGHKVIEIKLHTDTVKE
jgi:hypothetical protein